MDKSTETALVAAGALGGLGLVILAVYELTKKPASSNNTVITPSLVEQQLSGHVGDTFTFLLPAALGLTGTTMSNASCSGPVSSSTSVGGVSTPTNVYTATSTGTSSVAFVGGSYAGVTISIS